MPPSGAGPPAAVLKHATGGRLPDDLRSSWPTASLPEIPPTARSQPPASWSRSRSASRSRIQGDTGISGLGGWRIAVLL